ncbi:MAG TPA: RluA family pseudouridine synthase [Verrucomicrobiae bacterium]|jgi:23S rRNA pseudouridine1911/1915/1917 synthase
MTHGLDIIFEDDNLLVLNKLPGLVCHPTKSGEMSSLVGRVRLYLGKNGHLVNRLDRETSGVTIVAKNPATAGALGKLWESRSVEKIYLAIVHGIIERDSGTIDLPLGKDEKSEIAIKDCVRTDGAAAQTEYQVEKIIRREGRDFSVVRVTPRTGRKHQIRIHLAAVGHPVVGDKLYGGNEDHYLALVQDRLTEEDWRQLLMRNQALHALSVRFAWQEVVREFTAAPSEEFRRWLGEMPK